MSVTKIVTGDDVALSVTLKKNGAVHDLTGATIEALLIFSNGTSAPDAPITAIEATPGDYANGIVTIPFSSTQTAAFPCLTGKLEIQVTQSEKKLTWFVDGIEVVKGEID